MEFALTLRQQISGVGFLIKRLFGAGASLVKWIDGKDGK